MTRMWPTGLITGRAPSLAPPARPNPLDQTGAAEQSRVRRAGGRQPVGRCQRVGGLSSERRPAPLRPEKRPPSHCSASFLPLFGAIERLSLTASSGCTKLLERG